MLPAVFGMSPTWISNYIPYIVGCPDGIIYSFLNFNRFTVEVSTVYGRASVFFIHVSILSACVRCSNELTGCDWVNSYGISLVALSFSRGHFVNAPSQWEMTLHCNVVSHWLGVYTQNDPCLGSWLVKCDKLWSLVNVHDIVGFPKFPLNMGIISMA